jgi:hypothetical protein
MYENYQNIFFGTLCQRANPKMGFDIIVVFCMNRKCCHEDEEICHIFGMTEIRFVSPKDLTLPETKTFFCRIGK